MPRSNKQKKVAYSNLNKISSVRRKRSLDGINDLEMNRRPPRRTSQDSPNRGFSSNSKYLQPLNPSNSPTVIFNNVVKKKRGDISRLLWALSNMEQYILEHPDVSLSKAARTASDMCRTVYSSFYSESTLLIHYKRLHENPSFYTGLVPIFDESSGRSRRVNSIVRDDLIQKFKERIANSRLSNPTLVTFLSIVFQTTGVKYSSSWMCRFLKTNGFSYSELTKTKLGTRYHDSVIVLEERVIFLIKKIWALCLEKANKARIYVHDESWINERSNPSYAWSIGNVKSKFQQIGRRSAFASFWSLEHGLLSGYPFLKDLEQTIQSVKTIMVLNPESNAESIIDICKEHNLQPTSCFSLKVQGKSVQYIIPECISSSFFLFDVYTSSQKGVNLQMDTDKFLWSVDKMVRHLAKTHPKNCTMILQFDNARYHRVPLDNTLRSIIDVYPRNKHDGTTSWSMIDQLKSWKRLPKDCTPEWWSPKTHNLGRKSRNKSKIQKLAIDQANQEINDHKSHVKRFFRMVPEYRNQKTLLDDVLEKLSEELSISIELLWGTRGHSELAEIEHSWNFMKHFIKKFNPQSMKETKKLLKLFEVMDYSNRHSWRNRILLVMDCYLTEGYYSTKLLRKKYMNKQIILSKWNHMMDEIISKYIPLDNGFQLFSEQFRSKLHKQLTFSEIESLI